jgi:hypothetical protein
MCLFWKIWGSDSCEYKHRHVVCGVCNCRRGMDWWESIYLTTYTRHSELQVITPLSLISTLYESLHAKSSTACCVFTSRSLATASNSGYSSTSRAQVRSLLSLTYRTQLLTDWLAPIVFVTSPLHRLSRKHPSIVACVFIAAGTCLPIRCLETSYITSLFIRLSRGHCIATAVHATVF